MTANQPSPPESPSITMDREVVAGDLDESAIVHFARYLHFAETAALALLEAHGCGLHALAEHRLDLRVRDLRTRYQASARLGDRLLLRASPVHVGYTHLRIAVRVSRACPIGEVQEIAATELDFTFFDLQQERPTQVPQALTEALDGPEGRSR